MSFISNWKQGSFMSEGSMRDALEGYRPTHSAPTAELQFAQWTERVPTQPELVTAREMAGLTDETLAALAAEFEACPRRKRKDVYRFGLPVGLTFIFIGFILLAVARLSGGFSLSLAVTIAGAVTAGLGFLALCSAVLMSFQQVPLEMSYGRVGLFVGELNEQHPWLYKTFLFMSNSGAETYRQQVLAERGVLRGVDYLMMKQIATVHESLDLTQTARAVRAQVQSVAPAKPATPLTQMSPALESTAQLRLGSRSESQPG